MNSFNTHSTKSPGSRKNPLVQLKLLEKYSAGKAKGLAHFSVSNRGLLTGLPAWWYVPHLVTMALVLIGTLSPISTDAQNRGVEAWISRAKADFSVAGCHICEPFGDEEEAIKSPDQPPQSYSDGCVQIFNKLPSTQEHVTWYWQTSPSGTSADNPTTMPYSVSSSGPGDSGRTLYIRARGDRNGVWSDGVQTVSATYIARSAYATVRSVEPATSTTVDACGYVRATFWDGSGGINCADQYEISTDGGATRTTYTPGEWVKAGINGQTIIYTSRICNNDCAGNTSAWTPIVTWNIGPDITPPVAVCQDQVVYLDDPSGKVTLNPNLFDGGSTDNCQVVEMRLSQTEFDCSHLGSNTVTLTVTDGAHNTSTCAATVRVVDNIKPTAVCKNSVIASLDAKGQATVQAADLDDGSTDNCGSAGLAFAYENGATQLDFDCDDVNTSSYHILTVVDASGNGSTCFSQVTARPASA